MWIGEPADHDLTRALKFVAIELGDSPVLGQVVRLELAPGTTVLVGRNGAGKSAILERIATGLSNAWGAVDTLPDPGRLACEVVLQQTIVRYACDWKLRPADAALPDGRSAETPSVTETCAVVGADKPLWQLRDGRLLRNDGTTDELPPERTLLNWVFARGRRSFTFNKLAYPLTNLFMSVRDVPPGTPHKGGVREELVVPYRSSDRRQPQHGRLAATVYTLRDWHERAPETFAELVALGQRTGLLRGIHVKIYRDPDRTSKTPKDLVSVEVDGTDIGLLSDGTVRTLELLCALVEPENKLVLIEEPENTIHPGLLARLLHEIEAYSADRQIVMSTHSPQVVSWARPDVIRLVERRDSVTHVRGLNNRTIEHLEKYLHDEDTLGEFVFGGGLDDFTT